jgi:hypothetical protein
MEEPLKGNRLLYVNFTADTKMRNDYYTGTYCSVNDKKGTMGGECSINLSRFCGKNKRVKQKSGKVVSVPVECYFLLSAW